MSDYAITFAPTLDRPPETMVGETVYDSEGNAVGWIVNAVDEPDEATMLKLHNRMNAALLDMQEELLAYHPRDRENASSKELIDCVIRAHQIIEDAAAAGVGTCELVIEKRPRHGPWIYHFGCGYDFWQPTDCPMPILKHCPNCGKRIKVVSA